jgi:SAM-dependent methyltransferase
MAEKSSYGDKEIIVRVKEKTIGQFIRRDDCRFCQSKNLKKVLDLGVVPLAGGFLKEHDVPYEKFYPLELNFCSDCCLVQVSNVVAAETLFQKNYFFYSSAIGTLVDHFSAYAKQIYDRFLKNLPNPSILEIGCNDGVLLKPLEKLGVNCIGVDPATNVVDTIQSTDLTVINDFFSETLARQIHTNNGKVDAVLANYSFAHIDDMVDIMKGIKCILKDDGVFVFEIYYLGTLIEEMQYDMIYHEHMSYYSLAALTTFFKRFEMEIFDMDYIPGIRSGTVRFYARNIGQCPEPVSDSIAEMAKLEAAKKYEKLSVYSEYGARVRQTKEQLVSLLQRLKSEGNTIIGYGASGRGTTIMNYCGIDEQYIDYIIDDAPAKQGFLTPGTHVPITSWKFTKDSEVPDYIVLFAWAFTDEVLKKRRDYLERGGKFIIPLPDVRIVSK